MATKPRRALSLKSRERRLPARLARELGGRSWTLRDLALDRLSLTLLAKLQAELPADATDTLVLCDVATGRYYGAVSAHVQRREPTDTAVDSSLTGPASPCPPSVEEEDDGGGIHYHYHYHYASPAVESPSALLPVAGTMDALLDDEDCTQW